MDVRHLCLEVDILPQASGSSRLRIGSGSDGIEVIVGIVAVLAEPEPTAPGAGRISVSVGINGPGDAVASGLPNYDGAAGYLDDKRTWLEAALNRLYSMRVIPELLAPLCIGSGQQCWELKVHVQIIRADGCALDAASLAIKAALHATRVPKVVEAGGSGGGGDHNGQQKLVGDGDRYSTQHHATGSSLAGLDGGGGGGDASSRAAPLDLDLDETLDASCAFDAAGLPLYVTVATLDGHLIADCTSAERRAAGCALSLALAPGGQVAALVGGGDYGMHCGAVTQALAVASALGVELHMSADEAISAATKEAEGRGARSGTASLSTGNAGYLGLV